MHHLKKCFLLSFFLIPTLLFAGQEAHPTDPVSLVIFWVTLIFLLGIIGRSLALALNQPGVLGELIMGVLFGNICYFFNLDIAIILRDSPVVFDIMREVLAGVPLGQAVIQSVPDPAYAVKVLHALSGKNSIDIIKVAYVIDIFSRYGVIFLLFMVGLESSLTELRKTGFEAVKVALLGVITPIILGFIAIYLLKPAASFNTHLFVAATLAATSVGITVRVLQEMKQMRSREATIILGAAVLDDILGLMLLAVVSNIVVHDTVSLGSLGQIIFLALLFFSFVLLIGPWIIRKAVSFFSFMQPWEAKLFVSFIFVMGLAWLASLIQLATIIGAFAAGIVIHDSFFERENKSKKVTKEKRDVRELSIRDLVLPFEAILAPIFFMLIGIQVKLETFLDWQVIAIAGALIVAAIVGKLVSGFGARSQDDRLFIGIGMLPRGEVGLVFASIGMTLGVISNQLFSSIILMVIITTFITPLWLKKHTQRRRVVRKGET